MILLNLIMAAGLLALIGARSYLNRICQRRSGSWRALLLVSLILILALFAMTKFRNIDWRPATYIVLTTHMILVIAIWQDFTSASAINRPAFCDSRPLGIRRDRGALLLVRRQ